MIYLDSETCGFTGPMVLLQYAEDDGDICLHEIWNKPIEETIGLLDYICTQEVCAFNLAFDWFHVNKIYNILYPLYRAGYRGIPPVETVIKIEDEAPVEWCLKPKACHDVMLYARRQEVGQMAMRRKSVLIKKVPRIAAETLVKDLTDLVVLPPICGGTWRIQETEEQDESLVNLVLNFRGSTGLKALGHVLLGEDKADWPMPKGMNPTEKSWKPYGQIGTHPWGQVIHRHISLWESNERARHYAWKDVDILRKLHKYFGSPPAGDTDSELAGAVGAIRWRGFALDHDNIRKLARVYEETFELAKYCSSSITVRKLLHKLLSPTERLVVKSTDKDTLEALAESSPDGRVVSFCKTVLDARRARSRLGLCNRLLQLKRFHPEFKISGTKSNRMSGGGEGGTESINPQGIPRDNVFKKGFPLAEEGEVLHGGDADEFEVRIVDAVWHCPRIHEQLLSGKKFHAILGEVWFRTNYEAILESKGTNEDMYDKSKRADFGFFYGGQPFKISTVLGTEESEVEESFDHLKRDYPELYEARDSIAMQFCSMRQPGGIGSKVEWHKPADYSESILGFRRYFTLENTICKGLYDLSSSLPKSYKDMPGAVVRRTERGRQTIGGAVQTALYAAAFSLQAANMRAGCNHEIQSPGAEITKGCQNKLWEKQPVGINAWRITVLQVHDELWSVTDGTVDTGEVMKRTIDEYRKKIPLLAWGWDKADYWGDK